MYVDSQYKKMIQASDSLKSNGYQYQNEGLMKKFFSSRMYMNPTMASFLDRIDTMIIELTESVKKIQFYTNYTIDKNERRINL